MNSPTTSLARAIHFDDSDRNVFHNPARTGEWCISGGFEFSHWSEGDLQGKSRQAFANGWLGIETFGRVTFVAVTKIEPTELRTVERCGLIFDLTFVFEMAMAIDKHQAASSCTSSSRGKTGVGLSIVWPVAASPSNHAVSVRSA